MHLRDECCASCASTSPIATQCPKCNACLAHGNTRAVCESFGLTCCATPAPTKLTCDTSKSATCQSCITHGNSETVCESFGLDCSCLAKHACDPKVSAKCQLCISHGNPVEQCKSFGLDCSCVTSSVGSGR